MRTSYEDGLSRDLLHSNLLPSAEMKVRVLCWGITLNISYFLEKSSLIIHKQAELTCGSSVSLVVTSVVDEYQLSHHPSDYLDSIRA